MRSSKKYNRPKLRPRGIKARRKYPSPPN